ncbi:recombinase family protein [Erysipelothrix rhusiopathiae]|nr:recombinase family protein [Erysipelothrix rhusiopathiae]
MQLSLLERLKTRTDLKPALYGRVSTDDQARHGFSIPSQVKMGKELEYNRGLEYLEEIKVFIDDGISGTHENRKDYIELKRLIKNREINLVIITDTDRIGRDTSINTSFAKLLISMGAELFVITDPALDIYTPSGMMQFSMKSVINTYEVHNTRQRAVMGIIQSFEQGNYANPGCPFGYKKINKKLYVNDAEAKVVLLIHELYVEDNMSILKVVEYLRINGYSNGKLKWSVHIVRRILENTVYVGYVYRKDLGITFYKVSPPIVSIELKDKAIKLLRTRKRNSKKSSKHLYYQKVRCVDCDNLCINDTSSKGYRYYLCSKCLKRYSEVNLMMNWLAKLQQKY